MSETLRSSAPALYVDEDCNLKVIRNVSVPLLVDGEVVVKVLYSGVNPADVKHGPILGVRPTILGYDFCGRVAQSAPTSDFRVGDLVAGFTPTGVGKPSKYGAHQEYLSCPENIMYKVPENLPPTHAASLTTVTLTAADGLYNIFGFPLPGEKPADGFRPGPLLIWGASASVGISMLQLARASGASPIFVTASPKRHELLKRLGATQCFDYAAPDVVSRIRAAVVESKAGPIAYAADCAGSLGEVSSAAQTEACVDGDATILSVVVHPGKKYKMPMPSATASFTFRLSNGLVLPFPARPEAWDRLSKALRWAIEKYGAEFELPEVDVFEGSAEEALDKVQKVAEQGKFGKLVLAQPLS
ncbi:chaperonin 10-like protein [Colletotrichum navitas]|uniref:Chaperonin 10-like protein n=1 Tax=Colletotrichum navitas TaxID=681940 RepID=A0AAD8V0S0_9PEZI|nr:chaperonin 10-like protein [Colletotrichum navitas]KAK1573554.1 chaperonin 10-like protein [Colletotrichum navitas]